MKSILKTYLLLIFSNCFSQTVTISVFNDIGVTSYESKDHRSNVYEMVGDRKTLSSNQFQGVIVAATDYYPYGSEIGDRSFSNDDYKYGFQGQEKDDEVKGKGNSINYKYRIHDARVGRFFAVDPLASKYPYYSSYQFSGNKLIQYIELEGLEEGEVINSKEKGTEEDFLNEDGNKIEVHLKEFSVTPDEEPEREIIRWRVKEKFKSTQDKMSLNNRFLNLFRHPSKRRSNIKKISLGIDSIPVYKPILLRPIKISKSIGDSGTLSGKSKIINFNAPSDASSEVNYSFNFDGLGNIAPNRFVIRDSSGNIIKSGGTLKENQEKNQGILKFKVPANSNFTIEVQGISNPDAEDLYNYKLNYSYLKK